MKGQIFDNYPAPSAEKPGKIEGGVMHNRPIPNYAPPYGPKGATTGPGLGADNYGYCGTQGRGRVAISTSGGPGLGGKNYSKSPTQRG